MPNIKSAKKRVLIGEVRNARNKATKSELKTAIKKFEAAAAEGNRTEADGAYSTRSVNRPNEGTSVRTSLFPYFLRVTARRQTAPA